jgi:hypothetical protein
MGTLGTAAARVDYRTRAAASLCITLLNSGRAVAPQPAQNASRFMELILVLPGLLEGRPDGTAPVHAPLHVPVHAPLHAPALGRLLSVAGAPKRESGGMAAMLAPRYGVARQTDWPLAPIRLAALGIDPQAAYWLAADPASLAVGRADVQLAGLVNDLERADAEALVATLNAHFAHDGLVFVAPRPDALFVRVATKFHLSTHPPDAVLGRPLRPLLPDGPDAAAWRLWQSEIEMLLHEHPVNVLRESAGRPAANSLWFSCGGTLPPRPSPAPAIRTYATTGMADALAAHAGSPSRARPGHMRDVLADSAGAESIVVAFDAPLDVAATEEAWFAPAWDTLGAGSLEAVTLLVEDAGDAVVWRVRRPTLRQRLAGRFARHDLSSLLDTAKRDDR